ncbi:MAG: acyltransferase domain-containing protein, partial [Sphingobacteriaceae bacterium]
CAILLFPILGEDIRTIIYPAAINYASAEKMKLTLYAQPAIFMVQYATAKLWESWGLRPEAVAGHSLGEFVAAHLAGIFSLQDVLKVIVARCRLMQALPGGSMLAIRISAEKLQPILPENLSIAAINSKDVIVVSGDNEAIAAYIRVLDEQEIPCHLLENKIAFHSAMMDPVLQPFREIMQSVTLHPPKLIFISALTGKQMSTKELQNPEYWTAHIRKTVLFADAVDTLLEDYNFMIGIGPGNSLSPLFRRPCADKKAVFAHAEAPSGDKTSVYAGMLRILGQLWQAGFKPDWKGFYADQNHTKIYLPPYAYDYKKCWVEPPATTTTDASFMAEKLVVAAPVQPKPIMTDMLTEQIKSILHEASGIDLQDMQPG